MMKWECFHLIIHLKSRLIGYWTRLIADKDTKLCYIIYQCLFQQDRLGIYTCPWVPCIKNIFDECSMSGIWLSQDVHNKNAVELRLKDQ